MRRFITVAVLLLGVLGRTVAAEDAPVCPVAKAVSEYAEFGRIAVLDQGRVKPLDTYARSLLLQFSGRSTFDGEPAVTWLARVLFDPGRASSYQVFLINNPQIPESLGIEVAENRRYSFTQLEKRYQDLQRLATAAAGIDPKDRDIVETELIRIHENVRLYSNLAVSFAFALPHPDFAVASPSLREQLELPAGGEVFSYIRIALKADVLQRLAQPLERLEQSRWSAEQQEVVRLGSNLLRWSMLYRELPVKIMPSYRDADEGWLSPMDAMSTGLRFAAGRQELRLLEKMLLTYWAGRDLEFSLVAKGFTESARQRAMTVYGRELKNFPLELTYNRLSPFLWAKILYFLTFLIFAAGLMLPRAEWLRRVGWGVLLLGGGLHLAGVAMRIAILHRPPVSNLYETFLFVGLIGVAAGMVIERATRNWLGIAVAAICGYVFLSIAAKFGAEGDTLQMLVAVLNSNFWLATHVTTITVGYAGTCVAGVVGHVYILQLIFRPQDKQLLQTTHKVLLGALGFGLTFAFLGTNLGGIWADQSWGRFWGWDPKENGALMIILWTAILFHAKIGKLIGPLGLAVGSILGIIVVMWAWFGVNLLSVGLHSYGFTSGLATNLLVYVLAQLLFLTVTYPLAKKRMNA
ncbi:MAG: cytochrome c biogenesis protein CcsA [Candidatus Omnitrophica bacterium]|nr:cytochrome c biogenesis protein CcsA [Candidatus Omnitrophota bacterium]